MNAPRFKNLRIWHGRLPHWRADKETYFATFRHRRPLLDSERNVVLNRLMAPNEKTWEVLAATVAAEETHLIFRMLTDADGREFELTRVLESAKRRAGAEIVRKSGERFPPFFGESYDRIIRDEEELGERLEALVAVAGEDYPIYVRD